MTSLTATPCSHELRPGTTVCLRCQHAERGMHRARQRKLIARSGVAALFVGVTAAVGIAALTAWKGGTANGGRTARPAEPIAAASGSIDSLAAASDEPRDSVVAPSMVPPARGFTPLIPVGRTQLRDTMVAERAGDTVRVGFDLELVRTRRSDKFEAIVRSTLPQVYGAPIDSALRALPVGAVARAGDLTTALTAQGFRIPFTDGRAIVVWPETRPGRDGPLVVAYRAVASR